ncbi:MAG: lysophospholipid acyltransferase family protein [Eubacteriales bacterium]|nr:lysophospholipid acyltransferase family protein [Eubacteriales bacterium]
MKTMNKSRRSVWRWLLDIISSLAVWGSRIKIKAEGLEKLPADGKFLLVSNHVSAYDPIVLLHHLKKFRMMFISKPENFEIPIAGFLMKKSGFLAIDRENPRNALKVIYEASDFLAASERPVVIYPEGTRNKEPENGLLPFHSGVFKIAKRAGVPVVVCASCGTDKIRENWPRRKSVVRYRIAGVLDADYIAAHNDKDISESAKSMMEAALEDLHEA